MTYTNISVKYVAVFILAISLLISCQTADKKENKPVEYVSHTETDHEHKATDELSLNNGAKWKADSSTNKNVLELYTVISDANPVVLEDYPKTGKAIQTSINKMLSECRMKGPDHDALHHWLEPLMEENKKLSEVNTAEEGKELFGIIRKQIENYSDYFE